MIWNEEIGLEQLARPFAAASVDRVNQIILKSKKW